MKALIINAGNGKRLKELTGCHMPKGHILFNDRPFISYQIEFLKEAGLNDVIIDFDNPGAINSFKKFQAEGKIPNANITIHLREPEIVKRSNKENVPYCAFRSPTLRKLLDGNDIVKIFSDSYFDYQELKSIIGYFRLEPMTFASMLPKMNKVFDADTFFEVDRVLFNEFKNYNVVKVFGAVNIFHHTDLRALYNISESYYPQVGTFLRQLIKENKTFCVKSLVKYINMNEFNDYLNVRKALYVNI